MKILIADDNPAHRKLLVTTLESKGHSTLEAADGMEALQILAREKVDALFSDLLMPRMDGYRLTNEIRANDRFCDLPVIICTATYTSEDDEKLAFDLGADKFLRKPASSDSVLSALSEAVDRPRTAPRGDAFEQIEVLKEYSDRLVEKLEEKNIELEQRIRFAALSMDVTTALMQGGTLQENLQYCCEALVQDLDAAFARIWTHNERESVLELQASAGMYTHIDGPHRRVPVGKFKIGLIAAERKPHLTNSVIGDPRVPEQEWARREGLIAFAGYPLIVGARLVGVLAMFTRYSLSEAILDRLASIADAVALGIRRKQADEELQTIHNQFQRMLANSPVVLYNLKVEGENVVPTFVSDNMERLLGVEPAEAVTSDWWVKSLHPEDRDRMLATLMNGIKEGGYTAEYRVRHRDGTYRWIMDGNRVVRDAAGAVEVAGVWTDISEHKQEQDLNQRLRERAAEAQAANRAKSMFLSTMSHEIRTPMNAILGYAQLMLRDPSLGPDAKANLKIIVRSGEHLLALINDVLDMSKIEAGRTDLNPTTFSLSRLLGDLAAMFRLRAQAKALEFTMALDGESVPYIVADEGKIRQALINLLGNAIKFTKSGHILLHVTLDQRGEERLWMSARIEDTGTGISDDDQGRLFEPFSRAHGALNTQEGTGLGLAITRQFARLMGGDVTVSSSPGRGSIFRFEVPIERGVAGVAVRQSTPRRVAGLHAGTKSPKILVVDDQMENRDWLIKLLTAVGFSAQGADSGETAIRTWEEWNPQLILMDVHMPVMDGLQATRRIKADPRGQETAIVALTASAMDDDRQAVFQSGADGFLTKPCHEDELLEKMRSLLHIVYDYEEMLGEKPQAIDGAAALSADRLGKLPLELVHELRDATAAGNKKLLNQLILRVPEAGDAESARALQELADRYEYDTLTRLLEEACR